MISFPQGTASEATLVALLGAKAKKLKQVKDEHPEWSDNEIIGKLVAYGSCEYFFITNSIVIDMKKCTTYVLKK